MARILETELQHLKQRRPELARHYDSGCLFISGKGTALGRATLTQVASKAILGHGKLETTQVYTRVAIGQLQKVHAQIHPAERERKSELTKKTAKKMLDNSNR